VNKIIKIIAIVLASLFVVMIGVGIWAYSLAKNAFKDPYAAFDIPQSTLEDLEPLKEVVIETAEGEKVTYEKASGLVNIMLLGIDSTDEREAKHMGWRSDVMMLCTFDMTNGKLNMLSFPRDLYVNVYKMDTKTGEVTGTTKNRINTAYSKGGGPKKFGAENAMLTVENLMSLDGQLDINIDYYVSLDIDALPKIASAIGPVDVELNANVSGLGKKGEVVSVDEKTIDTYLRDRKTSGGDYSRAERQQRYIIAVAQKLKGKDAVSSAISIYQKISSDIQTNLSLDQIASIAGFIQDFNMDELTRHKVEAKGGRTSSGASVQYLKEDEFKAYLLENFYNAK